MERGHGSSYEDQKVQVTHMLTFAQFISEALTSQSMNAMVAKFKKLHPSPQAPSRGDALPSSAFRWFTGMAGWYNTKTKEGKYFSWSTSNYHVTQVVNNPQFYGLTLDDIMTLIEKTKDKRSSSEVSSEVILQRLSAGKIDGWGSIEGHLMQQGWVKITRSGGATCIVALSQKDFKAVVREAMWQRKLGAELALQQVHYNRGWAEDKEAMVYLRDFESMERFLEKS